MENADLVFDIGFHVGEDSEYYLHRGYRVIAVEADPELIAKGRARFDTFVTSGQLTLLHRAVSDVDDAQVHMTRSACSHWTSLYRDIANREFAAIGTFAVSSVRLDTLMRIYGVPFYCKVDIEGLDATAASTLLESSCRPAFFSLETECVGDDLAMNDADALYTLRILEALGYTHFKLVDQDSLQVLSDEQFYNVNLAREFEVSPSGPSIGHHRVSPTDSFANLNSKHGFEFPPYGSGPFGVELAGQWVDLAHAERLLLMHRADFFRNSKTPKYSFWCDWHATKL
jgi:FkbM family methyltransferase